MIPLFRTICGLYLLLCGIRSSFGANYVPSSIIPPEPTREFRAVWVATIANIDWPSKPGLSTSEQKNELLAILDMAVKLRLNAVILQVRSDCDAVYASKTEPWSEYLTGRMGGAPEPFYDPLAFAVEEAHRRGLELHAWFNPFRASHISGKSPIPASHVSRSRPQMVRQYGKQLWLDPGDKAVHEYTIGVIADVVRRYDIDGVHIDDYFYPYAEKDASGKVLDFADGASWRRYVEGGGNLPRDDWRRENVNTFIQHLNSAIKAEKSWVKFGVSPFGIWRPGHPPQIRGKDAYAEIYTDTRKWINNAWADYFAPQLYWTIDDRDQSFPALLKWWGQQNTRQRHLWPGIAVARSSRERPASETINQVRLTRKQTGVGGSVFYSAKALMQNRVGVADALRKEFANPALVPESPWLDARIPGKPRFTADESESGKSVKLSWSAAPGETVWQWAVQTKVAGKWHLQIIPGNQASGILSVAPDAITVNAVSRVGRLSPAVVLERKSGAAK